MKDIYYCSSVQTQLFKFNTRSHFKNYIDIDNIDYLPDGGIEVAVKKIIFDIDVKIEHKTSLIYMNKRSAENPILALQSTICMVPPFNDRYDNILCMFNLENIHQVEFNNQNVMKVHQLTFI